MPLSDEERSKLEAVARQRGIDLAKLIAAAEESRGAPPESANSTGTTSAGEKPKLFMYLLPFVTVREVRHNWLGLSDSFAGDSEVASAWAAKHGGNGGGNNEPPPTE